MRLNQAVALVESQKTRTTREVSEAHQKVQKSLTEGHTRRYEPNDEEGEKYPPEIKLVQYRVADAIGVVRSSMTALMDAVATQEYANTEARADVRVGDKVILVDVPVTYLLFLQKRAEDLKTFFDKLPVLDPSERWRYDDGINCYVSDQSVTNKTKKSQRPIVLYEATKEHPAQTQLITDDIVVGRVITERHSGAISESDRQKYLRRIEALQDAIKVAIQAANVAEVERQAIGDRIFDYLLA